VGRGLPDGWTIDRVRRISGDFQDLMRGALARFP
jgi:hypothetical protein